MGPGGRSLAAEAVRRPLLIRLALYLVVAGGILMAVQFLGSCFVAGTYHDSTLIWGFLAGLLGCMFLVQVAAKNAATVQWRGRPDALKVAGGIVGLLAGMWAFSVASPDRFNWPMYRAAMKSDLRRLVTAESLYYAGHGAYTRDLFALDTPFQLTTDVQVLVTHDGTEWRAHAAHVRGLPGPHRRFRDGERPQMHRVAIVRLRPSCPSDGDFN